MATNLGVESPVRNDVTIPIGTSEVTVMDQATAYAVFPAGGYQSRRHGISQILDYGGDVLYDFDKDEPPAKRVLSEQADAYMNQMLSRVPYVGTARRAALDNGILTAGKTGTTQAYRDAWFIGFTGNFTTAVWFGNDDYTSTNKMTGGTLPAMTFKRLMDYAHQGITLRAIPGVTAPPPPKTVAAKPAAGSPPPLVRPRMLSVESTKLLKDIGEQLKLAPPLAPQKVASAD
jgi:penicillin-binding protein 1A